MTLKYQKIPVIIEAEQLTERTAVITLEGEMIGNPGDWLITGVEGEQYPCKDSIFRKTYKPVDRKTASPLRDVYVSMTKVYSRGYHLNPCCSHQKR